MGSFFLDQFSLLHFSTGVIMYFWGFSLLTSFILHTLFEIIENTPFGIRLINTQFAGIWPGGKPKADDILNILGDTLVFVIGWYSAYKLDTYGTAARWYSYNRK